MSSLIVFVEILVNAGHHIESPDSRTNGRFLSVVKENWSNMVRKARLFLHMFRTYFSVFGANCVMMLVDVG